MPILNTVARMVAKPIPRVISPSAHAIIDYILVGSFVATAGFFWRRSKRAAIAALICSGAELAVNLLTDYPGGVSRAITFRAHRDIDLGLAAMAATMPEFLAFKDEPENKLFLAQGAVITAINELTQFPEKPQFAERGAKRGRAA